ncbi:MAG TPA: hypothetical protein VGO62_14130 [Myxococcota bacterium]
MLASAGVQPARIRVRLSSSSTGAPDDQALATVTAAVGDAHPGVRVVADEAREQGRAYYAGDMLGIDVERDGAWLNTCDGGAVSWTQVLLADNKERLVTSGFGAELAVKRLGIFASHFE